MRYYSILSFLLLLNLSCSSFKGQLKAEGNYEDAIHNAIMDFSSSRLFKKGSVFKLDYKSLDDNFYYVTIVQDNDNKYLYSKEKKIEENILPSKNLEFNNSLFVWWDVEYLINQEVFNKLNEYKLLKDDEGGWIRYLDIVTDDSQKGADYFICKNNLLIYKRIINSSGIVSKPTVNCK